MRWCPSTTGSAEYILPLTHSTTITPVSSYTRCRSLMMYLGAAIEHVGRRTWRPWRWELGGRNHASLEMQLAAVIMRDYWYHLEALIRRVWRCTWRPWSSEIGVVLGGGQSGGGGLGERRNGSWDSIRWLTCNCGNLENWVQHGLPRDERLAVCGRQSILRWCSTQCTQLGLATVPDCHFRSGSGLSLYPNCQLGYSSMVISQPIWIGRVVIGSPSGSINRFNEGSCFWSMWIVSYQNHVFNYQGYVFACCAACNID